MMDWAMIRKSMDDAMQACIENDGVMDEAAKQLVAFVPADPNKKADADWLKERGWNRIGTSNTWRSPCGVFMMGPSGWFDFVLYGEGRTLAGDPTLMTVALFEAAAMEAMKHGE